MILSDNSQSEEVVNRRAPEGRCTPWAIDEVGGRDRRDRRRTGPSSRMSKWMEKVGYDGRACWMKESMAAHWSSVSRGFQERGGGAVTVIMR